MALNKQTLKTRALTAVIFMAFMLSGLLINQWTFYLLFFLIHWGCWSEYEKLIKLISPAYQAADLRTTSLPKLIGSGFLIFCLPHELKVAGLEVYFIGLMILIVGLLKFIFGVLREKQNRTLVIKNAALGLVYISLSWGLMIHMRDIQFFGSPIGYIAALTLVGSIWINDTMQYLVGSLIGKTPFSSISPNKTMEGTVGGSLLCVILVSLLGYFLVDPNLVYLFLGVSIVAAITGTAGDLIESKLKRLAGVKDSGSFMPGHGGFLDRFDSLLLAVPFTWLLLALWQLWG